VIFSPLGSGKGKEAHRRENYDMETVGEREGGVWGVGFVVNGVVVMVSNEVGRTKSWSSKRRNVAKDESKTGVLYGWVEWVRFKNGGGGAEGGHSDLANSQN
jgi:hypothetical protein